MRTTPPAAPRGALILLSLALLACTLLAATPRARAQADPAQVGEWSAVFPWPIIAIHSSLLPNGQVLIWDGNGGVTARLWNPATAAFTQVPHPVTNLFCTGHSYLPDGRLHVTGGHIVDGVGLAHTNIFDWRTSTWYRVGDMNAGRWYPTNVTLPNGDVLVLSGNIDNSVGVERLPQVWNPTTGWRNLTSALLSLPLYPFLHVATSGKVFMAGPSATARYLDTTGTGSWSTVAVSSGGYRDYGNSVLYDTDKVVLIGGHDPPIASAEVIDLSAATPAWRAAGTMAFARRQHSATLLADGTVLVTGGTSGAGFNNAIGSVYAAEVWNPDTETFTTLASAAVRRLYHSTALLLPDGRVLSAGGGRPAGTGGDTDHLDAEIFSPPYLFKGPRPTITSAPTRVTWGQVFQVKSPEAASIQKVHLISLSSVTHANNMSQRINRLSFTKVSGALNITAPPGPNHCIPGVYMLFLVNGNGVPSVARMIRVDVPAATTLPAAPTDLIGTALNDSQVRLDWTDNADNEEGFELDRSLGAEYTRHAILGPNSTSFTDTGLEPNTYYYYRVRAYNARGASAYSNKVRVRTLPPPPDGTGNGLLGEYYDNIDFTGAMLSRTDPTIEFDWGTGSPAPSMGPNTFSVRWVGRVQPRYTDTYTFFTRSDDGVRLWVNGQLIINNWTDHAPTEDRGSIFLEAGVRYTIRMDYYENGGGAVAMLGWFSNFQRREFIPQSQLYSNPLSTPTTGLTGVYFNNPDFTAQRLKRNDPVIDFNWGAGSPDFRVEPDTFSARWTGWVIPRYTETYTFITTSDDGVRLWIAGQLLVDNWTDHAPTENSGSIALVAGRRYKVRMDFYENLGGAVAKLEWQSATQAREVIPSTRLQPD